ncbi:hypothetical protein [Fodinibius sp.]|uniref:hypothetical protein n=1 Tax=Fodinibius sp. TaxID=1872440 RepID=UPI002ACEA583|nr:hypothetical protein [Fodinibius sp.]MDZ7657838.1 hypothetical protein [Fodinibius sp.]
MSTFSTILSLLIVITACTPSKKDDLSSKNDKSHTDSLIIQSRNDTMGVQPPAPSLPPGTVKIKANIEKIKKLRDEVAVYITVSQVLQRGSSTPLLQKEQSVKVDATTFNKNANQRFLTLEEGKQFILLVGNTQSLGNQSQKWTLNNIETDSSNKTISDDS